MNNILKFLAEKTSGNFYKSMRYCIDEEVKIPSLAYDDRQEFTIQKRLGESDSELKTTKNLLELSKRLQKQAPLFTYFLDGSRRIYKVDDIEYAKRIFPIVGGQIGVACCQRKSSDTFGKALFEKHLVLALPSISGSENGGSRPELFFNNLTDEINQIPKLKRFNIEFSEILRYSSDKNDGGREEYMNRGTAKIQDKMIECEKKVVNELVRKNLLNENHYLIKDGSLQYQKTSLKGTNLEDARFRSNFRRVLGVSKSFNPEFSKDKRGQSNAAAIADLKPFHRTPVVMYKEESRIGEVYFAIWYVRIREAKHNDSPFAGILKLEKVLVTDEEIDNGLDSSEVDMITANIINERNPVCYGKDQRWANHLYPVYLTESYIKSQYLSDLHFINLF